MTTSVLDIIDTAVKIGLGAFIAGVTGYVLAVKNNKYEKIKYSVEVNTSLLKELSHDFESEENTLTVIVKSSKEYL